MGQIDTQMLKDRYPVEMVIARYGIELRPIGRALVGRCPFHVDSGRPNFHVYPANRSWICYRCGVGGDVISFVQRIEGVGFREALARNVDEPPSPGNRLIRRAKLKKCPRTQPTVWGSLERACLSAAAELYHNRLLSEPDALTYIEKRGLDLATIERHRIGYASGDELLAYLRWRHLPIGSTMRIGLLGRAGQEVMAGRVVVPEVRAGQPIWLVGRTFRPEDKGPKYLGLPGYKPLMGWEEAATGRVVYVVEGPFDWLALRSWGFPALALVGTHIRPAAVKALSRFERVYLLLDDDPAGRAASTWLAKTLDDRAVLVPLPGVKDVADLSCLPDGRARFIESLEHVERARAA